MITVKCRVEITHHELSSDHGQGKGRNNSTRGFPIIAVTGGTGMTHLEVSNDHGQEKRKHNSTRGFQ